MPHSHIPIMFNFTLHASVHNFFTWWTLMCQPVLVLPHSTQLRANHKIVLSPPFTFLTCLSISPYRDRNREPRTLPIFDEKRHPLTVSIFKEQFSYSHFRPKDNFQIYLKQNSKPAWFLSGGGGRGHLPSLGFGLPPTHPPWICWDFYFIRKSIQAFIKALMTQ